MWINASIKIKDVKMDLKHSLKDIIEFCDGSWINIDSVQFIGGYLHSEDDLVHFEDMREVLQSLLHIDQNMDNWDADDWD